MPRPVDATAKAPSPPALNKWPRAPKTLTGAEKDAWERIGEAAMCLGSTSAADLIIAERAARVMAKVTELFDDEELKPSTLASMLRIEIDLLKQLGLSPQARRQIAPLPSGKAEASGYEDIE